MRGRNTPRKPQRADADSGLRTFKGPSPKGIVPISADVGSRFARTGTRDTRPEVELRRILHARGLRFRVDKKVLAAVRRRADVVFGPARVAVFVDGCFWHGCPEHATWPKHNAAFWREKIETNQLRDRDTDRRLADAGWAVVRVWEHEDMAKAAARIARLVRHRRG